jgi:antitoxin (DNA-binding transcriptional repressor) of toxin-antitoxin stability system
MIVMSVKEKVISAAEFKAKCLRIFDELQPSGIVITKRGRPVARVLPATVVDNHKLIGSMKGKIQIKGDLYSTGLEWDAESRHAYRRGRAKRKS